MKQLLNKQEVLKKRQQILTKEHPDMIIAMANLAVTRSDQGRLNEAAAMQQEVLKRRQHVLGHKHPGTIAAMCNLAITVNSQRGKAAKQRRCL